MKSKEWRKIKKFKDAPRMCRLIYPRKRGMPIDTGSKRRKRIEYNKRLAKRDALRKAKKELEVE